MGFPPSQGLINFPHSLSLKSFLEGIRFQAQAFSYPWDSHTGSAQQWQQVLAGILLTFESDSWLKEYSKAPSPGYFLPPSQVCLEIYTYKAAKVWVASGAEKMQRGTHSLCGLTITSVPINEDSLCGWKCIYTLLYFETLNIVH